MLEVVGYDRATGDMIVASGFGARADWYRNLLARPQMHVVGAVQAPLPGPGAASAGREIMSRYARRHRRLARRVVAVLGHHIRRTDEEFAEVGRSLTFLLLTPGS